MSESARERFAFAPGIGETLLLGDLFDAMAAFRRNSLDSLFAGDRTVAD